MKKLIAFAAAVTVAFTAAADEGMWLLPYLQKMNGKDMKSKGCKLSPEEIYSANRSSLKDAIVIFGGGCTGEIVSPEGLLFTNHHCGYGSIQALSSVEHDYLKYGFWAMSNEEELPVEGLAVRFIREIRDVTPELVGNVPSIAGEQEYRSIVEQNRKALLEQLQAEHPDKEVIVRSFFGGNQYFAFIIDVFRDVRLVGTPPSSIGKFGGETDNWMWPRHTGDFSIFRVYADRENKPAAYSPDNVPYKAEKYLTVSTKGYKEGDFTMIMGFPGSTQRYMTSYEIDNMLDIENPQRIFIRGERQAILKEDMAASDKVRIQYASKYAGSSNYWKNSIGMSRGLKRLNVKAKKQEQEASFRRWAAENTLPEEGYIDALDKIERAVKGNSEPKALRQYLGEAFYNAVEILVPGRTIERLAAKGDTIPVEQVRDLREAFADWYGDYSPSTDRKVAKRMLTIARENMKRLPSFYTEIIDGSGGGRRSGLPSRALDRRLLRDRRARSGIAGALRRGSPQVHCRSDASVPRQVVGFGCQFHDPSDLWTGAPLSSGRRCEVRLLHHAEGCDGEGEPRQRRVRRACEAARALRGGRLRPLCQRAGRTARRFPGKLRYHGRQLRLAHHERPRRADRSGFRRQLGGDVGRRGLRARVAAHHFGRCPLRALHHRQVRRSRLAAG